MSSWLLLALPGAVYLGGLSEIWLPLGLAVGQYLNWQLVAKRLRLLTQVFGNALTIPAYFHQRFQDNSNSLRIAAAVIFLIFFTVYAASGIVAMGVALHHAFGGHGLSRQAALWLGAVIVIGYCTIGGFLAVAWIDFFQGILIFIALILVPVVAIHALGGLGSTLTIVGQQNSDLVDAFHGISAMGAISLLAWGLGYFGQPHIIVRFMAIRSTKDIPKARFICMAWMVLSLYGALFTGIAAIAFFHTNPLIQPSSAFLALGTALLNPWLVGLLTAAILSAAMSTISSQLLISSSALAEDVYHGLLRRNNASNKELVWVNRLLVILVAAVAVYIAQGKDSTILDLVSHAWAGLGASFGPLVLLSLFWSRMTRNGALAGMITGAVVVIGWIALSSHGGIFQLYAIIPGFLASMLAIIIFSLADRNPSPEILAKFQQAQQELC
jgi:sodium/proline symporter